MYSHKILENKRTTDSIKMTNCFKHIHGDGTGSVNISLSTKRFVSGMPWNTLAPPFPWAYYHIRHKQNLHLMNEPGFSGPTVEQHWPKHCQSPLWDNECTTCLHPMCRLYCAWDKVGRGTCTTNLHVVHPVNCKQKHQLLQSLGSETWNSNERAEH